MSKRDEEPDAADPGASFTGKQFDALIDAIRGNATDRVEAEAEIHALAMRKQLRPDNETHPDISVYNPRGERDYPKPELKCEMFIGPYPLEKQTLLVKEVEYLNLLEPGSYDVTKGDGTVVPFRVAPTWRLDGKTFERLTISFPCADDDQRQNYPPFVQMLREVIEQNEVRKLTGATQ